MLAGLRARSRSRTDAARAMAERKMEIGREPSGHVAPVLEAAEHPLDAVASLLAAPVMLDGLVARLAPGEAGLDALVGQGLTDQSAL